MLSMATTHGLRRLITVALALGASTLALTACTTEKSYAEEQAAKRAAPRPAPVLVLRHHVGGTHHRVIVRGEVTYAAFGNSLMAISTQSGTVLHSLELMPFGTSGALVALAEVPGADELVAVLDGTAVMRISIADPSVPEIVATRRVNEIGFGPRTVGVAGGEIWISGDAGIVPWSKVHAPFRWMTAEERKTVEKEQAAYVPPAPLLAEAAATAARGEVGAVIATGEGLVAPVGRRVYAIDSGRFVGAASRLEAVPTQQLTRLGFTAEEASRTPAPLFTFILQSAEGAQVGLMGPDVREIDSRAVPGTVRCVRLFGATLFAVTDTDIVAFSIARTPESITLGTPTFIAVRGARDIDAITDNDFAVVGSFGRAFYRWQKDGRGDADTFYKASREPSRLTYASTDRRRILAGGEEGSWLYTIGDDVALVNQPVPIETGARESVAGGWGRATIAKDRRSVLVKSSAPLPPPTDAAAPKPTITDAGELVWTPSTKGEIAGVESLDGKLWIWHQDGVDVLGVEGGALRQLGAFRIEGPVKYLFPQRVGGAAAYVSEFGGFGLLDFIDRDALPTTGGERLVDIDADGTDDVVLTKAELEGANAGGSLGRITMPIGRDRSDLELPKKK